MISSLNVLKESPTLYDGIKMKLYVIEVIKVDPFNISSERQIFTRFDEYNNYINNKDFYELFDILPEIEEIFDLEPLIDEINKLGDDLGERSETFYHGDAEGNQDDEIDFKVTFSIVNSY